ncbi:MAG: PIG-L deacetylase family protein [Pseudomonadota bacterium]
MSILTFKPDLPDSGTVLCLGAHCDDIEIGCGGTLMELRARHPKLRFAWQVFSGENGRDGETRAAAERMLGPACDVDVAQFRGSFLPYNGIEVKEFLESVKTRVQPDLVFTHFLHDRHQDHRVIAELTWNTFRNHAVFEYEIPKFEGDLEHPNAYVPLSAETVERKVETLMTCFPSQLSRQWFDRDLFKGLMRLRGVECNSASRFAEAFHVRKLVL